MATPIRFALGGGQESVLFSTHIMEQFGGREAALKDFGGYLIAYSAFLDEHLKAARKVRFEDEEKLLDKFEPDEHALRMLLNPRLPHSTVAFCLNVARATVWKWRKEHKVAIDREYWNNDDLFQRFSDEQRAEREARLAEKQAARRKPKPLKWYEEPANREVLLAAELNATEVAELLKVNVRSVHHARSRLGYNGRAHYGTNRSGIDWDSDEVVALLRSSTGPTAIGRQLGVSKPTIVKQRKRRRGLDSRETMEGR